MISPIFEQLATDNTSGATFLKVDVDDMAEVAAAASVAAMPTFKVYKSGKQLDEVVGANPAGLKELIDKHL